MLDSVTNPFFPVQSCKGPRKEKGSHFRSCSSAPGFLKIRLFRVSDNETECRGCLIDVIHQCGQSHLGDLHRSFQLPFCPRLSLPRFLNSISQKESLIKCTETTQTLRRYDTLVLARTKNSPWFRCPLVS